MRLMTLGDRGAGSSCGMGAWRTLASTSSRRATSYWSLNFEGSNLAALALDEHLGKRELVFVDGGLLDVAEEFSGLAQLVGIAENVGHHARLVVIGIRSDGDDVLAAAEGDFAEGDFAGFLQSLADDSEGFG